MSSDLADNVRSYSKTKEEEIADTAVGALAEHRVMS